MQRNYFNSYCSTIYVGIEALAIGCNKIKSFIAKGCTQMTDRAISCLAQSCPDLETLNLGGCSVSMVLRVRLSYAFIFFIYLVNYSLTQNLEDKAVISLAENCKNLQYLCLSGCNRLTDASLVILAQQCHQLNTLEVAGCSQFTDTGFQALARVSMPKRSCNWWQS